MKNDRFNETEWNSAVFLAHGILELKPYPEFKITEIDLKIAARELLEGLLSRSEGKQPSLSGKTREVIALIQAYAASENARILQ